jgi:hypothetical protein
MWNVKISDTYNNTGNLKLFNSYSKYLSNILGHHDIKELQKIAILGTTHILRRVLL